MLEEYSANQIESMQRIFNFTGVASDRETVVRMGIIEKKNTGYKQKPVLPKTRQILRQFFQPYNRQLAMLLGDNKWRYEN